MCSKNLLWIIFISVFLLFLTTNFRIGYSISLDYASSGKMIKNAAGSGEVKIQQKLTDSANMWMIVSNNGIWGNYSDNFTETDGHPGFISCQYGAFDKMDYLFMGTIWIGAVVDGDTLVSCGHDGWYIESELFPGTADSDTLVEYHRCPDHPQYNPDIKCDQEFQCVFTDTTLFKHNPLVSPNHFKPLGVKITSKTYCWGGENHSDYIIVDYLLKNIGKKKLKSTFIGFLMDADCGPTPVDYYSAATRCEDDISGNHWVKSGADSYLIAWASDYTGKYGDNMIAPSALCAAVIDAPIPHSTLKQNYNWWISSQEPEIDWGPGPMLPSGTTGTPNGDVSKYWVLSGIHQKPGIENIDEFGNDFDQLLAIKNGKQMSSEDTRFLLSFGGMDINPGDEIPFKVLIFCSDFINENLEFNYKPMEQTFEQGLAMAKSNYSLNPIPMIPRELKTELIRSPELGIKLKFKVYGDVCKIKGFNVYRSLIPGVYGSPINKELVPVPQEPGFEREAVYLDKNVVKDALYYYVVTSVDPESQESSHSNEIARKAGVNIIHVPGDSTTIQSGVNGAWDGDTVLVADGTYSGSFSTNISFNGKKIYMVSESGASKTFIDCGDRASGFVFENGESSEAVVKGFTISDGISGIDIKDGSPSIIDCILKNNAKAVLCGSNSTVSPVLTGCIISQNKAGIEGSSRSSFKITGCKITGNQGTGILCGSHSTISQCVITGNLSSKTGGIYCDGDSVEIENCVISGNKCTQAIGAGGVFHNGFAMVSNCLITDNSSVVFGGGIYCYNAASLILNCTIAGNSAGGSGGGIYCYKGSPEIVNCILWGDTSTEGIELYLSQSSSATVSYSNFQGGESAVLVETGAKLNWLEGNMESDPLFRDLLQGDYHLQSFTKLDCGGPGDSPCIDSGDPASIDAIIDCDLGLGDVKCDMGAFGGDALPMKVSFPDRGSNLPTPQNKFSLYQNFPNPFNPVTSISFSLIRESEVSLKIYDISGRLVKTLINRKLTSGIHSVVWNGKNDSDMEVASGVYIYRLTALDTKQSRKMILMK